MEPNESPRDGSLHDGRYVSELDDPSNDLVFTLLQSPAHGTLYLGDVVLEAGASFTQFDIDHGLLSYESDETEPFAYDWAEGTPSWDGGALQPVHQGNMTIPENGESVIISFEGDTAGYPNFIGWYRLDPAGTPADPQFLWASASPADSNFLSGTTFTLEGLEAGTAFGLFVVRVGANDYHWVPELVDAGARFRFDAGGNIVAGNRAIPAERILYSGDASLNPDGITHATSGIDGDRLMILFQDSAGGGVNDLTASICYEGSPTLATSDSFSFMVTDGTVLPADLDPVQAGYVVSEDRAMFSITIDAATQAA